MKRSLLVLALVGLAGCRSAAPSAAPAPRAPSPAASRPAPTPSPAGVSAELPRSLRWVQRSAEYRAIFLQTYRLATEHVERAAEARAPGSWAVVTDADETAISNASYEAEIMRAGGENAPFSEELWRVWVQRRAAPALPGALAFFRRVHELGGRIAVVTNRSPEDCPETEAVFQAQGLPYDAMLCGSGDKNPRFERVRSGQAFASGPVEVVAFLGDNIRDFPSAGQELRKAGDEAFADFGARFFAFPNPLYGSFLGNPD